MGRITRWLLLGPATRTPGSISHLSPALTLASPSAGTLTGIICFKTLNLSCPPKGDLEPEIFDIAAHFARSGTADKLPKTPILCKPNIDAMEVSLRITNVCD